MLFFLQEHNEGDKWDYKECFHNLSKEQCEALKRRLEETVTGRWRLVDPQNGELFFEINIKSKIKLPKARKKKEGYAVVCSDKSGIGYPNVTVVEVFQHKTQAEKSCKDYNKYAQDHVTYSLQTVELCGFKKQGDKKVTEALRRTINALQLELIHRAPSCQAGVVRDCQCTECVLESGRAILKKVELET